MHDQDGVIGKLMIFGLWKVTQRSNLINFKQLPGVSTGAHFIKLCFFESRLNLIDW